MLFSNISFLNKNANGIHQIELFTSNLTGVPFGPVVALVSLAILMGFPVGKNQMRTRININYSKNNLDDQMVKELGIKSYIFISAE